MSLSPTTIQTNWHEYELQAQGKDSGYGIQRFRNFIDMSSERFWEVDNNLIFTFVSPSLLSEGGYDAREFLGKSIPQIMHLSSSAVNARYIIEKMMARQEISDMPLEVMTKFGTKRAMQVSARPFFESETNDFIGYHGNLRDISTEVDALNRVSLMQMRMLDAIESISEGFALYDAEDCLVHCNHKYRALYPTLAIELVPGAKFERLLKTALSTGDVVPSITDTDVWLNKRLESRHSGFSQSQYQLRDGRWIQATDRKTSAGNTVSVRIDITEMKLREIGLVQAKESAEIANKAKTEFLAMISHELRTPLNAILGFTEVMQAELLGPLENPHYKEYLKDIHLSSAHLLNLITDILDLSRAEIGKLELEAELLDAGQIIQEALRVVEAKADEAGLQISCLIDEQLPEITADARKFKQIILNLLTNSIKFTPEGGVIKVSAYPDDNGIVVKVCDSGIGMDIMEIPQALAPFTQLDSGLDRKFEGVGLGLYLTQSFVELHGGTLTVASQLNEGTTITIKLPFLTL